MNFDDSGLCNQTVAQNKSKLHAKVWMVSNRHGLAGEIAFLKTRDRAAVVQKLPARAKFVVR
jgi:hypothetical protein